MTGLGHHSQLPDAHFELQITEDRAIDMTTASPIHSTMPGSSTYSLQMSGSIRAALAVALRSVGAMPTEVFTHSSRI